MIIMLNVVNVKCDVLSVVSVMYQKFNFEVKSEG